MTRLLKLIVPPLVTFVAFTLVAEVLLRVLDVPRWKLPPPSAVLAVIGREPLTLLGAAARTAESAFAGFVLAGIIGLLLAIAFSSSRLLERSIYPYTVFFQTVPIIAIAPLLVLWFGPGTRAVAVCAFIVSVFPVIANALTGLRSTDPALRDLFRLHGASRVATLWKLKLPAALPHLATGLRIAAGLAVIGAIVGEFVAGFSEGRAGLGILVLESYRQLRTDLLFAGVLTASLLGLLLFTIVHTLGFVLLYRWHASAEVL